MTSPPSGLSPIVEDGELLARFLLNSNRYRKLDGGARAAAFIPDPYDALSVSRISGIDSDGVHPLGQAVADEQHKTLHGWAVTTARIYRQNRLDPIADEPPPRHANVVKWPKLPDPAVQKGQRKLIAEKIAENAITCLLA